MNEGVRCRRCGRGQRHTLRKGEDRRRGFWPSPSGCCAHGWRKTAMALIAKEAGVHACRLLPHFEFNGTVLNAVLDARDDDDDANADYRRVDPSPSSRVPKR